ncbi:hypothetical protein J1N35_001785 [Gossypium stocksii]|uniref:RNase H type-1 domain-containing protein n=1 Tax=Gossypium stocksii TaxID=47602 RepID=A0A9D3WIE7_9ROSI|nr:hypothetical protein J1N35_001785 [Gossypium stocksii]
MARIAKNYFQDLFASLGISNTELSLQRVQKCITEYMNAQFTATYIDEEIWATLKAIGPTKALGADGLPTIFFQKCWHIVGTEEVEGRTDSQYLEANDANRILRIPLVLDEHADMVIWHGEPSASRIVARTENGKVEISNSYLHIAVGMAFDAEAIACSEAVLTGLEIGYTKVVIEGDSKSIINKCMAQSVDKSQVSAHI